MLEDSRIPASGFDPDRLTKMINGLNQHLVSAWHNSRETGKAETPFKEGNFWRRNKLNLRIDQNMKRHRAALAFRERSLGKFRMIFRLVLNDGQLEWLTDLWSGETHARSIRERFAHMLNEVTDALAANFLLRQRSRFAA